MSSRVYLYQKPTMTQSMKSKSKKQKKQDIRRLRKQFPNVSGDQISKMYEQADQDVQLTVILINSLDEQKQIVESTKKIRFLSGMFESIPEETIKDVFNQCDNDVQKSTAYLLEVLDESTNEEDSDEADEVYEPIIPEPKAKTRRLNWEFWSILQDAYPNMDRDEIRKVLEKCNNDIIQTIQTLESQELEEEEELIYTSEEEIEEESPPPPQINPWQRRQMLLDEHFPQTIAEGQYTRGSWSRKTYWQLLNRNKHANNDVLNGTTNLQVNDIQMLLRFFPSVDDIVIKEVYLNCQSLNASEAALISMGCTSVRKTIEQQSQTVQKPKRIVRVQRTLPNRKKLNFQQMNDSDFRQKVREMESSRKLHQALFKYASQAFAESDWDQAKELSNKGKEIGEKFKNLYKQLYLEIFRRNNLGRDPNEFIDLHGLHVQEAIELLDQAIESARGCGTRMDIITGKGLNSIGKVPRIRPAVENYLISHGFQNYSSIEGGFRVLIR